MTAKHEKRLIKRLKARDERAFREFVELHQDRVYNLIYRLLGDREEARDVSQEVFVTVFKSIQSFRGDSRLSTWLYRVSANHAKNRIKYLRRRAADRKQSLDDTFESDMNLGGHTQPPRPDGLAIGHELERIVQRALASLDEDHRVVIVLRDVEHLSYDEVAEITGLTMGTVKSRLHRARTALRDAVAKLEKGRLK